MRYLRLRFVVLIIWLLGLFGFERLNLGLANDSALNLASWVYVLAGCAAIFVLLVPNRRWVLPTVSIATVLAYVTLRALEPVPLIAGLYKFVTVTELLALTMSIGLSWWVSIAIADFYGAVEAISMPEGYGQLLKYEAISERMQLELGRARRHQRPVSMAVVELDSSTVSESFHEAVRAAQASMHERYMMVQAGVFLSRHLRETDVVSLDERSGRFVLLLPETSSVQTDTLLRRLAQQLESTWGMRFRYSMADFPNDALTTEELLRSAGQNLREASMADVAEVQPSDVAETEGPVSLNLARQYGTEQVVDEEEQVLS
jgi:hypothetical protein